MYCCQETGVPSAERMVAPMQYTQGAIFETIVAVSVAAASTITV